MRDAAMTLVDGRTVAYTELGDAHGPVAMHFHGAPARAGELPVSPRRLGRVMVDRAWGRVRAAERKGRWLRADCRAPQIGGLTLPCSGAGGAAADRVYPKPPHASA